MFILVFYAEPRLDAGTWTRAEQGTTCRLLARHRWTSPWDRASWAAAKCCWTTPFSMMCAAAARPGTAPLACQASSRVFIPSMLVGCQQRALIWSAWMAGSFSSEIGVYLGLHVVAAPAEVTQTASLAATKGPVLLAATGYAVSRCWGARCDKAHRCHGEEGARADAAPEGDREARQRALGRRLGRGRILGRPVPRHR